MGSISRLSDGDDWQLSESASWPSLAQCRAFVTVLTSDNYVEGALVLATSLRAVDTKFPLAVLYTNHVTDASRDRLAAAFDHMHRVDPICVDDSRLALLRGRSELRSSFTKLRAWTLVQYDRVVLLDADTLVLRNVDGLLDRAQLSAAPDAGWPDMFNSGVMVIEPSLATFHALRAELRAHGSLDGGDQGLLNQFFGATWRANPALHLPFTDNVTPSQSYMCIPALRAFGDTIRIVHFIGRVKPWHCHTGPNGHIVAPGPVSEDLRLLVQRWWAMHAILTEMEERHQRWAWRQMVTTSITSTTTTTSWSSHSSWSRDDSWWWAQYPRPSNEVIPFSYLDSNASRPPRRHRKRKDLPKPKPVVRPPHAMILPISSMAWATADPASGLRRRRPGAPEPVIAPDLVPRPTSMIVDDPRVPSSASSATSDSTSSWSSDSDSDDDGDWRVLPRTPPPSPALDPVADDHDQDLATLEQRLVRYMLMTTITTTVEATTTESTVLVSRQDHFWRLQWDTTYLTTTECRWGMEHYGFDESSGPVIPARVDSLIASMLDQRRKQEQKLVAETSSPSTTTPSLSSFDAPSAPLSLSTLDGWDLDPFLPQTPPPSPASVAVDPPLLVDQALNLDVVEQKLVHYVLMTTVTTTVETTTTTSTTSLSQDEHFWRLKWDVGYLATPTAVWGLEHYGVDETSGPVIPERVDSLIASMLEQQRKQQALQKPAGVHLSSEEHFGRVKWDDAYLTTEEAKWGLEHYGIDETSGPVIPERVESLIASMLEQKLKQQVLAAAEPLPLQIAPSVPMPFESPSSSVAGSDAVHDALSPPTVPSASLGPSNLALLASSSSSISSWDDDLDLPPPPPPPSPTLSPAEPPHALNPDALEQKLAHYVLVTKVTTTAETTTTLSTNHIAQDEHFWRLKWDTGYLATPTAVWGMEHYGADTTSGPVVPERVDSLLASMLVQQHKQQALQKPAEPAATVISPEEHFGRVKWDDQYLATDTAKWGMEMYGVDETSGPVIPERVESLIASMLEQKRKQEKLGAAAAASVPTDHGVAPSRPAGVSETSLGKSPLAPALDHAPLAALVQADHAVVPPPLVTDSETDLDKPLPVPSLSNALASLLGPADHDVTPPPLTAGSDADSETPRPAPSLSDALATHFSESSPPFIPDRDSSLVASAMMDCKDSRLAESEQGAGATLAPRPAGPEDSLPSRLPSWNLSTHAPTTPTDLVEQNPFHLAPASHYSWPVGEFDDAPFDRFSTASQLVPSIPETSEPGDGVERPPLLLRPRPDEPGVPAPNLDAPAASSLWPDDDPAPLPMKSSASSNFAELDHDESTKHAVLAWLLKTHQAGSGSSSSAPTVRPKPGAASEPVLSTGSSPASSVGDGAEWDDVDDDDAPLPLRTSYGSLPRPRPPSRIRFDGLPGNLMDEEDLAPVAISIPEPSEPGVGTQLKSDYAVVVHVAESVGSNDDFKVPAKTPSQPDLKVPMESEPTGLALASNAHALQPIRYQHVTTTTTTAVTTTSTTATTSALTQAAEAAAHEIVQIAEPLPSPSPALQAHDLAVLSALESDVTRPSIIHDAVEGISVDFPSPSYATSEVSDGSASPALSSSTGDSSLFSDVLDLYGTVPRPPSPEVKESLPALDLPPQSPAQPVAQEDHDSALPGLAEPRTNRIKSVALAIRLLQRKRADMTGNAVGNAVPQDETVVAQDAVAALDPMTTLVQSDSAPVAELTAPPTDAPEPAASAGTQLNFGGVHPDHSAPPMLDVVASPHAYEPPAPLRPEPPAGAPTARIKSVMAAMRLLQRKRAQLDTSVESDDVDTALDQQIEGPPRPALTLCIGPDSEPGSFASTDLDDAQLPPIRVFDTVDSLRVDDDDAGHAVGNESPSIISPTSSIPLVNAASIPAAQPSKTQSIAPLGTSSEDLLPPPPRRGQSRLKSSALTALAAAHVTAPSAESLATTASPSTAVTASATATTSLARLPDPLDVPHAEPGAEHDSTPTHAKPLGLVEPPMSEKLPPPPRRGQSRFKSAALAAAISASHAPRRHSLLAPSIDSTDPATNAKSASQTEPIELVEVRPTPARHARPEMTAPKPALDSPPPRRHTRPPRPSRPFSELTTPPPTSSSGPSKPEPTASMLTTAPAVIVPSRPVSPSTSLSRLSVTEKFTVSPGKVTTPVRRPTAPSAPTETEEPAAATATPTAPPLTTRLPSSAPFVSVQRLWQDGARWRGVVAIVLIAGTAIAVLGLLVGLPFLLVFAA
ncbi:hypothetical protein AMAG_06370 [Allomyces macrogynus ATCC 38327]|uniref:glycogenin glucosyltransferase n=1 Tax=Allomyces macrogynus (strain ATCC 38327) TaxID=578462 RepID=A0A0L0SGI2_ALLM3|nr:hypothetical protein AMAG_06370 [Allomyces macrogynus ATCC 38327]|eukprot:KNE61554.1 hypothetical protein AMAG_06370 [Allomyces macrogynus ATCC 38327]